MLDYTKKHGIKNLNITRDIVLDRKIRVTQDDTKWLNNIKIDFHGHRVKWVGVGADSLSIGIIEVHGVLTSTKTTVIGDHAEYTSDLTVASTTGIAVGDYVLIDSTSTDSTQVYLNHIVRIEEIVGNVLKTDTVRRLAVSTTTAPVNVTKVNPVDGLEIIGNPLFTADNQSSRSNGIGAIQYFYCVNCKAIARSERLWFKTFVANFSSRITAIVEGKDPAAVGGGEGYTLQFVYTTHSMGRVRGDNMRHAIDITASWHNVFIDCEDWNGVIASYSAHRAYEYNNKFIRCKSFGNKQAAFAFGTLMFGNHIDETYLINCEAYDFVSSGISFSNKGKGLYIHGGTFRGIGYALITSNNDTFAYDARFESGVQVTTAIDINTSDRCELHNCHSLFVPNSRSLNISTGRRIDIFGGVIRGVMTLGVDSVVSTNNTHIICPPNTNLIGTVQASFHVNGGKFEMPVDSTVGQTYFLKELSLNRTELIQWNGLLNFVFNCTKNKIKGCTGSARIAFTSSDINKIDFDDNDLKSIRN